MGDIGVPDSYDVWIRNSLGAYTGSNPTHRVLAFTDIAWQRIMADVSVAQVTVPRSSLRKGESFYYPTPWRDALVVFRNGYQVWSGPVLSWTRNGAGDLVISAKDAAVGMQKQYIGASRNYIDEEVSQVVAQILADAQVGVPGVAPVPMTIGAFYPLGFYPGSIGTSGFAPLDAAVTMQLDYRRFDRVWSVLSDLASKSLLYFCCANDHLYLNETGVRQQLGVGDTGWPQLTDENVVGIPAVTCDGLDTITEVVRTADAHETTFYGIDHVIDNINNMADPVYHELFHSGPLDYLDGVYLYPDQDTTPGYNPHLMPPSAFLGGIHLQGSNEGSPATTSIDGYGVRAALGAHAGPSVSVEQVQLSPTFSHPSLADDLSNLLPGTRFTIGFEDRSMFDIPFAERKLGVFPGNGARPGAVTSTTGIVYIDPRWEAFPDDPNIWADATANFDWRLASLWTNRIDHLRLIQLDVSVQNDNGALKETVTASFVPTIQYILKAYTGTETLTSRGLVPGTGFTVTDFPARPRFVG